MVDGPFILLVTNDKFSIYGFDCDTDTEFDYNFKDKLTEAPLYYL